MKIIKTFLLITLLLTPHCFQAIVIRNGYFDSIIVSGGSSVNISSSSYSPSKLIMFICYIGIVSFLVKALISIICSNSSSVTNNFTMTERIIPSETLITQIIDLQNLNIDSIAFSDRGTLTIQQATTDDQKESCTITAPENVLPLLFNSISNNRLKVWQKPNIYFSHNPVITYHVILKKINKIHLSDSIKAITDTSQQSHVSSDELYLNIKDNAKLTIPINASKLFVSLKDDSKVILTGIASDEVKLKADDSSRANITIETTDLQARLKDSSKVILNGQITVDKQKITCSDSSKYNANNFVTNNTAIIDTSDSSTAYIGTIQNILQCKAKDSSKIYYRGSPKITKTKKDSAKIIQITE